MSSFQSPSLHCAGAEKDKDHHRRVCKEYRRSRFGIGQLFCHAVCAEHGEAEAFQLPAYEPRCADSRDYNRRRRLLPEKKTQKAQHAHCRTERERICRHAHKLKGGKRSDFFRCCCEDGYADKAIEHAPEKRGRNGFYPPFEKALRARQDEIRHRLGIGNRARHTEKESRKKCSEIAEEAEEIKLSAVFNAADGFGENREKCFPLAAERREHADRPYEQRHSEIRQHIEKPMPQSRKKSYLHIRVPTVILRSTCRTARRTHATIIAASRQKYAHEKPTDGRPASSEKP